MAFGASYSDTVETDVAIIGYGGAGASAAIVARDAGADVVILEKMKYGGGNTRLGAAAFFSPPKGMGPQAVQHIEALCFGNTDKPVIEAYVEESLKNEDWIKELGDVPKFSQFPKKRWPQNLRPHWPLIPGTEAMISKYVGSELEVCGQTLWTLLSSNVERRGAKVMFNTAAKELLTNEKGEVTGIIAESDGKKILVKANRAVILTCGGFSDSPALRQQYLPFAFYPAGHPGNTGDGILMAQKVGAQLWHMTVIKSYFAIKPRGIDAPFSMRLVTPKYIYVNKEGVRFTNETGWEVHFIYQALMRQDPLRPGYPSLPIYGIIHKDNIAGGPLEPGFNVLNYKWSQDNSAELAKGWIIKGETVRELGKKLSINEANLEDTITKYNSYCMTGVDPEFGRAKDSLQPIDGGPYYAVELWPRLTNTMGGPRRDYKARVMNTEGNPIPRLYSAGELGSLWGFLYCGGGNVGEALAVGRIAGKNAAAEKPLR